jgi:hypothetical protein
MASLFTSHAPLGADRDGAETQVALAGQRKKLAGSMARLRSSLNHSMRLTPQKRKNTITMQQQFTPCEECGKHPALKGHLCALCYVHTLEEAHCAAYGFGSQEMEATA